jgi:glutaredoxin
LENWTWLLLFLGATAMMVFSGYLMFIMASKFVSVYGVNGICYYCVASALFALTLFVLTLIGRSWEDSGQLVFSGLIVGMVTLVGTLAIYNLHSPATAGSTTTVTTPGEAPPPVTTTSGPSEIALAQHLSKTGAKVYSAYWCPHCHEQKELFGQQAAAQLPYVECDPAGQNTQSDLCKTKEIKGYPTWEINGQMYSGAQSLQKLAELSGYQGPQDFINK